MNSTGITIKRFPYEEPYHIKLAISASNGFFEGCLEYYCNASDLKDIGETLLAFPNKIPDSYQYEVGSAKPEANFAFHLALRAYTTDKNGQCAIEVVLNNNRNRPFEGACRFSLVAEPAAIHRLGKLLSKFAELQHHELIWTVSGDGDALS